MTTLKSYAQRATMLLSSIAVFAIMLEGAKRW